MSLVTPPASYGKGYYTKAFVFRGIYVLGNDDVSDEAVYRAAEIVFNSLAGLDQKIIDKLVQYGARFAVIPDGTPITDLPDYADLGPSWSHYRGLGGVIGAPTSSSGEENLIPGHPGDPYAHSESIGLHEWLHAIEGIGLKAGNPALHNQFKAAYSSALQQGLWANTYADDTFFEYFAETAQAYFNDNPDVSPPNGIHNSINTRAELAAYDPTVYALHSRLFGTAAWEVGDFYGSEAADTMVAGPGGGRVMFGNGGDDLLLGGRGRDYLLGGDGADTLRGGAGRDDLDGGAGHDTADFTDKSKGVVLSLKGDKFATTKVGGVSDDKLKGIESVLGSKRGDKLTGDGLGNMLSGNAGNDTLKGGRGDDTLSGGAGADSLSGGSGLDQFLFNLAPRKSSADKITDFRHGQDKIALDDAVFAAIGPTLEAGELVARANATKAKELDDRLIYNTKTGALLYDADGSGGGAAIKIATLTNKPAVLDIGDFLIV